MSEAPPQEAAQQSAQTVGYRLRQAREQKGLSLDDAAGVTRVAKGYLKALEDDCLDRLPNEAYAKGFLRVYARYLDLEADDIVASFSSSIHDTLPQDGDPQTVSVDVRTPEQPRQAKKWLMVVLPVILLCAILAATFLSRPENDVPLHEAASADPRAADKAPAPSTPAQPGTAEGGTAAETGDRKDDIHFDPPEAGSGGIILRLKAIEDGALEVTIDNMISQHYDLRSGDIIEWKGEKAISLDLQNAGGVEAEMNGKKLAPFGDKGMQAHIMLNPDAVGGRTAP